MITNPFSNTVSLICESQKEWVSQRQQLWYKKKNCSKWRLEKQFCQNDSRSCGHTTYSGHYSIFLLNCCTKMRATRTTAKWILDTETQFWPAHKAIFSFMKKCSMSLHNSLNNLIACLAGKHMSWAIYFEEKCSWLSLSIWFLKHLLACKLYKCCAKLSVLSLGNYQSHLFHPWALMHSVCLFLTLVRHTVADCYSQCGLKSLFALYSCLRKSWVWYVSQARSHLIVILNIEAFNMVYFI